MMKLKIKVVPASSRDSIEGWLGDVLKIKVKAPPEKGKANKAVIRLLEKKLELSKGSIGIDRGTTSNIKIITISSDNSDTIRQRLKDITP